MNNLTIHRGNLHRAKLSNFLPLELVSRYRDHQLQVGDTHLQLFNHDNLKNSLKNS